MSPADAKAAAVRSVLLGMQGSPPNPFGGPASPGAGAAPITRPPSVPTLQSRDAQGAPSPRSNKHRPCLLLEYHA